jgi:hypothetical protein
LYSFIEYLVLFLSTVILATQDFYLLLSPHQATPLPAWGEATLSSHRNTSVQPATSLPKQINQEQCQLDSTGATVDLVNLCMGYITSANGTQPIANPCCAKFLQDYHG